MNRHSAQANHESQTSMLSALTSVVQGLDSKVLAMQDARLPAHEATPTFPAYEEFASTFVSVLKQMSASVSNIGDTLKRPRAITNEHFDIPRPVDQNYTGREDQAKALSRWMLPDDLHQDSLSYGNQSTAQRRFVVCGIGGSGKTQFVSKFAQDHRDS
jgi:hypothetical protein